MFNEAQCMEMRIDLIDAAVAFQNTLHNQRSLHSSTPTHSHTHTPTHTSNHRVWGAELERVAAGGCGSTAAERGKRGCGSRNGAGVAKWPQLRQIRGVFCPI